jgi:transposase
MSTIQRAYKTELDLNDKQVTACRKHAGAARWAYNWGLQRKREAYRQTLVIDRDLNAAKNLEKLADSSTDSLNACERAALASVYGLA